MEARKLLYTAMAFAPAVLMAGIGIHARTYVDPYEWPKTHEDHERISAYIPVTIDTMDGLARRARASESEVRQIAQKWVDGGRSGDLKPLIPISSQDLSSADLKVKILDNASMISRRLVRYADKDIALGDFQNAVSSLVLASDVMNSLKYSDFMSLFRVSLCQQNVLKQVERIYSKVDLDQKRSLDACMARMKGDLQEFAQIASHAKKLIIESMKNHDDQRNMLKTASKMVPESSYFELPAMARANTEELADFLDSEEFMIPNLRIEARQCLLVEERNRLLIQRIKSLRTANARA